MILSWKAASLRIIGLCKNMLRFSNGIESRCLRCSLRRIFTLGIVGPLYPIRFKYASTFISISQLVSVLISLARWRDILELGLKNKVALVPASSKGIGLGVAKVLAAEGCKVVISSSNQDSISKARDVIVKETRNNNVHADKAGCPGDGSEEMGETDLHHILHPSTACPESGLVQHSKVEPCRTIEVSSTGVWFEGNYYEWDHAGSHTDGQAETGRPGYFIENRKECRRVDETDASGRARGKIWPHRRSRVSCRFFGQRESELRQRDNARYRWGAHQIGLLKRKHGWSRRNRQLSYRISLAELRMNTSSETT